MTLGTALAVFGGLLLALLALHGWWSTRRGQARRADDIMRADGRIEPPMDAAGSERSGQAREAGDTEPAPPRPLVRAQLRLDALIDALVPLALEAPVSGEFLIAHLPPSRRAGSKPFYIEGLDVETGDWETPAPGRRYSALQAGVQMASRSGPLNEIEYSEFMQKVQTFADAAGASIEGAEAPDMLDVVARSRELDSLSGPLDAQLTVTLRTRGVAWSVGFVQQVAARLGFVPGIVPGRFVLPGAEDGSPPVLVLAVDSQAALSDAVQGSAVRECTLALDVPQTAEAAEAFPAWHRAATQLAEELDARAVDDEGREITLHAFAAIGNELTALYRRLEALDLAAGSAAARRLFS